MKIGETILGKKLQARNGNNLHYQSLKLKIVCLHILYRISLKGLVHFSLQQP